MKKRVELSSYCWSISALSTALMCGVFVYALKRPDNELAVCILGGAIVFLFLFTLCYMPLAVSLDNKSLNINIPLKIKKSHWQILRMLNCVLRLWAQRESAAAAAGSAGTDGSKKQTSANISHIMAKHPIVSS